MTGKLTLSFDITVAWKRSSVWDGCMPSAASVESRWDGWRAAHPDTVAAAYPFDDIMPCGFEDGSTPGARVKADRHV